jgi:hypothetical protein
MTLATLSLRISIHAIEASDTIVLFIPIHPVQCTTTENTTAVVNEK